MYCPKCSQPQVSDEVQFCSRCGLPLKNLKEIVLADGKTKVSKPEAGELSLRQKGVRQGVKLMLLSIILIPAYVLLAALFPAHDRLVESSVSDTPFEKLSQAILFTIFLCGLARVLYARFFQQGGGSSEIEEKASEVAQLDGPTSSYALPPASGIPVSSFGTWRANTGEMAQARRRASERTTKSLDQN